MYPSDVPPPEYIPQPMPQPPPPPPYPHSSQLPPMPRQINADVFVIQPSQLRIRFGMHPVDMTCTNCNSPVFIKFNYLVMG